MKTPNGKSTKDLLFIPIILLWIVLIDLGYGILIKYSNTPGKVGLRRMLWPSESKMPFQSSLPRLLIFLHPKCSCSDATLSELAILMTQVGSRVDALVLFYTPVNSEASWKTTRLWSMAQSIPGVQVIEDVGGSEAARFGAVTSGQTFLYSPKGNLIFSGGITPARGHSGDNNGRSSIVSLVRNGRSDFSRTPVFGCSLATPTQKMKEPFK